MTAARRIPAQAISCAFGGERKPKSARGSNSSPSVSSSEMTLSSDEDTTAPAAGTSGSEEADVLPFETLESTEWTTSNIAAMEESDRSRSLPLFDGNGERLGRLIVQVLAAGMRSHSSLTSCLDPGRDTKESSRNRNFSGPSQRL